MAGSARKKNERGPRCSDTLSADSNARVAGCAREKIEMRPPCGEVCDCESGGLRRARNGPCGIWWARGVRA